MKKSIYILAAMAALFATACGKYKKTENGVLYKVIEHGKGEPNSDSTSFLFGNFRIAIESNDSTLKETFTANTPNYIPVFEPVLYPVFKQLVAGDSVELIINADTFCLKIFGQPRPPFIKEGDNIRFTIKVQDIISDKQYKDKQQQELNDLIAADSTERAAVLSTMPGYSKTPEGVSYTTVKPGSGRQVKKGDKVTVLYRGTFLNGQVFDENQDDGFEVTVGLGSVIEGWESMLLQMKNGQKVKAVIPWELAYKEYGNQGIPPYTSLVFEMEITKIR